MIFRSDIDLYAFEHAHVMNWGVHFVLSCSFHAALIHCAQLTFYNIKIGNWSRGCPLTPL